MRGIFVTLLLILATAAQPLLAIPAACQMPGSCPKMTCAGCCAENPCCAVSDRQQSSPVKAVTQVTAALLPAIVPQAVTVPLPAVREIEFAKYSRGFSHAHAPPPLALNCIQLI